MMQPSYGGFDYSAMNSAGMANVQQQPTMGYVTPTPSFGVPSTGLSIPNATQPSTFGTGTTGGFGSGFGTNTNAFGSFASSGTSSFGNTNTSSFGNANNSGFGNTNTSGFGNTNTSGFGNTNTSGFGNTNTSGFGNTNNGGFGNANNSGFGNANNGGFGNANTSGFGNANNNGFGNANNNGFGNTNNGGFGNANNNGGFGNANNNGSFGAGKQGKRGNRGNNNNQDRFVWNRQMLEDWLSGRAPRGPNNNDELETGAMDEFMAARIANFAKVGDSWAIIPEQLLTQNVIQILLMNRPFAIVSLHSGKINTANIELAIESSIYHGHTKALSKLVVDIAEVLYNLRDVNKNVANKITSDICESHPANLIPIIAQVVDERWKFEVLAPVFRKNGLLIKFMNGKFNHELAKVACNQNAAARMFIPPNMKV
jgi:hypothetical protein